MIPEDWLEYVAKVEKELKRPPNPPRRRQPKVTRHMSRNQRIASSQTPNLTRAMYVPESEFNQTPTIDPERHTLTKEVGPNDRYNPTEGYRGGKATVEPTQSNKTSAPGRRAYGGGTNKGSTEDIDALTEQFRKGLK